jgi:hypothetical protein
VAERIADPAEGVSLCLAVLVGVDLQRDGQPRVTEDELGIASRNAEVLQQCGGGVPQVMHLDQAQIVMRADPPE